MVNQAAIPDVTKAEEKKYREKKYADVSKVINENPVCTSCNETVKSMIINGKPLIHPFLETLLCEKCYSFYGDGNFSVDEDGSDKYCRWCGQGGTLYLCSSCTAGFCKKCIKRNLSRSILKDVEGSEWDCFCCNVKPLFELRAQAWASVQHSTKKKKKSRGKSSRVSKSDEESEYLPGGTHKPRSSKRSKKPSSESMETKAYKYAFSKQRRFLNQIISVCDVIKLKSEEIMTTKLSRRATDIMNEQKVEVVDNKIKSLYDNFKQYIKEIVDKAELFIPEWKAVLVKAIEEDKKNKEASFTENGESKKSKKGDRDEEEASTSKRTKSKKSRNAESEESDEEESKPKKSNRKSKRDSDEESDKESQSMAKNKRSKKEPEEGTKSKGKNKKSMNGSDDDDDEKPKKRRRTALKKKGGLSDEGSGYDSEPENSDDEGGNASYKTPKRTSRLSKSNKKSYKDSDIESEEDTKSRSRNRRSKKL